MTKCKETNNARLTVENSVFKRIAAQAISVDTTIRNLKVTEKFSKLQLVDPLLGTGVPMMTNILHFSTKCRMI